MERYWSLPLDYGSDCIFRGGETWGEPNSWLRRGAKES